jgi:hypothetical protein
VEPWLIRAFHRRDYLLIVYRWSLCRLSWRSAAMTGASAAANQELTSRTAARSPANEQSTPQSPANQAPTPRRVT